MFALFTPGPRDFKVGDRAVLVGDHYVPATLSGNHHVVKITRTHYHVVVEYYKGITLYLRATCQSTKNNWGCAGIITLAEAEQQMKEYQEGKREPLPAFPGKEPSSVLFYGQGAL